METWKNASPFWKTQIVFVLILTIGLVFATKADKSATREYQQKQAVLAAEVQKYHQVDGTVEMVQVLPGNISYAFSSHEQTLLWYANAKVRLADGKAYIVRLPSDSKALVGSTVKVWVGPRGVLETTPVAVSNLEQSGRGPDSFRVVIFLFMLAVIWPIQSVVAWEAAQEYRPRYRSSRQAGLTRQQARKLAKGR